MAKFRSALARFAFGVVLGGAIAFPGGWSAMLLMSLGVGFGLALMDKH